MRIDYPPGDRLKDKRKSKEMEYKFHNLTRRHAEVTPSARDIMEVKHLPGRHDES